MYVLLLLLSSFATFIVHRGLVITVDGCIDNMVLQLVGEIDVPLHCLGENDGVSRRRS
jgi:hypothetical protein